MSIYDKASIALIPSGTKASKLYSVLPANGDGDFTHSRGSTATRVNKDGLIESVATNVPRLDYPLIDGVVQDCPALLLEPSRTNNFQRSEEFDNGYWTKTNSTITANQIVSPDGSQNADTLTQSSAGGYLRKDVSFSGSETASFFVKANSVNFVALFSGGNEVYFDLINGYATSSSGSTLVSYKIDSYGNGWYRCSITTNYSGSSSIRLYPSQSDGAKDTTTGSVYIWGAQFEAGSYQTSYIPTSGSTVTRSADLCNNAGTSAQVNNDAGAFFVEIQALEEGSSASRRITLSDESSSDRLLIETDESTGTFKFFIAGGGTVRTIATSTGNTQTDMNKLAIGYDGVNAKAYINGTQVGSITNATTRAGMDTIDIADWNGTTTPYFGKVKQIIVFNEALSDSELATLTS